MRGTSRSESRTTTATGDPVDEFGAIIEGAIAQESRAIEALVREFRPALVSHARHRHATDPEGLADTTLSTALAKLGSFDGRDRPTFRAYLFRILRRRLIDEIRRESVRPRTVPDGGRDLVGGVVDEAASRFDDEVADEVLVDDLLTTLTAEQRQILEMRMLDDLSIQETAERTGRSVTAVKAMQRRAISSLRLAIGAAVVLVIVAAVWLSVSDDTNTVVDNSPADDPGLPSDERSSSPDGGSAELLEVEGDEQGGRPVLASSTSGGETSESSPSPDSAAAVMAAPLEESPGADGAGADEANEAGPAEANQVCTVVTDGTPAVGEMAFVTWHFDGPYHFLDRTPAYLIGRGGDPALLSGFGGWKYVPHDRTDPFEIAWRMFDEDGRFQPVAALGGGEIKVLCETASEPAPPLCVVTTDGSPAKGETASVTYDPTGPYQVLDERWTYVVGKEGASAMPNGGSRQVTPGATHQFTIDGSMWRDGQLDIRSAFRQGEAFVRCTTSSP